ncbi:hypothetical protein [Acinetobacter junii]|uniref:hypothetical protein n=1 Tax=Acinetobacter junii TaxID=40215 RepID=UPI003A8A1567
MSKILGSPEEFAIHASPAIAKELGTPAAVFLQKLYFLLNHAKNKNGEPLKYIQTHQNRRWWWHSFEKWQQTLGLYSVSTIKRAVAKLKELGIIEIKKLNPVKRERVNYYAINYKKLKQIFGISATPTKVQIKPKAEPEKVQGTEAPVHAEARVEDLAPLSREHRALYLQLRRYKVDISFKDPRLHLWLKTQRDVISYAASAPTRLNITKWHWHTPQQILPNHLLD